MISRKKNEYNCYSSEFWSMELQRIPYGLTVCKVKSLCGFDVNEKFCFAARTDEELSLVCRTEDTPSDTVEREDGWKCFRIKGVLDFSLIGILARITSILASGGIGVFAVSTFNTDYILVKSENYERSLEMLASEGYTIIN